VSAFSGAASSAWIKCDVGPATFAGEAFHLVAGPHEHGMVLDRRALPFHTMRVLGRASPVSRGGVSSMQANSSVEVESAGARDVSPAS
jgi:hypothetical protein